MPSIPSGQHYGLLDRAPDAGGLRGYAAFIETSGAGPAGEAARLGQVASTMLSSAEYTGQHAGQAGYLSALAHGATRAQVALDITQGPEAQVHWLGHINDGTILVA